VVLGFRLLYPYDWQEGLVCENGGGTWENKVYWWQKPNNWRLGRVVLCDENEREVIIEEVLYVPGLKTNLISLRQLLQKGFVMQMEGNCLSVLNKNRKLTIKAKLSKNRTFCVVMKVVSHQCFALSLDKAEWLWNMRFDHLNFKDLSLLSKGLMVKGLPQSSIPNTVCKECIQYKQTRGSF